MFTGIIEQLGVVEEISNRGSNLQIRVKANLNEISIDNSISHNGICLTVESVFENGYQVTAIEETIEKTTIGFWKKGDLINLEKPILMNGRLDGHIVQGHVDGTALCTEKKEANGSVEFTFSFNKQFAGLIIEKGSICVDGISLTAFNVTQDHFTVAIIPYTFQNTNLSKLQTGNYVNLEFDVLGKYVQRMLQLKK